MYQKRSLTPKFFMCVLFLFFGTLVSGCLSNYQNQQSTNDPVIRVLFIGNSYTFTNDLPDIIKKLAESGGYNLETTSLAQGGWTLNKQAQSTETIDTIKQGNWDYVVLQEQSIIPSNSEERHQSMYPAIRVLHTEIEKTEAKTVLFMTWGYRDGLPQSNFDDFYEMQAQLTEGYLEIANELNIMVSPIGEAWQNALQEDPTLDLWNIDGSHPNVKGSYLAACVFYAVIYQENPEGLDYVASLDETVSFTLQSSAAQTVFQDLERWNIK